MHIQNAGAGLRTDFLNQVTGLVGRGVCTQDAVAWSFCVELGKRGDLDVKSLRDGLDHQPCIPDRGLEISECLDFPRLRAIDVLGERGGAVVDVVQGGGTLLGAWVAYVHVVTTGEPDSGDAAAENATAEDDYWPTIYRRGSPLRHS